MTEEVKQSVTGKGWNWLFLGFGVVAMALLNPGAGSAGYGCYSDRGIVSTGQMENLSMIDADLGERIIVARRGNRSSDESGEGSNGSGNGKRKGSYGSGDGSGTGDRPQDGSGKGKGKGSGSGNCDGSGSQRKK